MILSDGGIKRVMARLYQSLTITPFDEAQLQPASYDVRLASQFCVFNSTTHTSINPHGNQDGLTTVIEQEHFVLHPGQFVLGHTVEVVIVPPDLIGRVDGKSSLARLGLVVHQTAGFIDPGYDGTLTLELSNSNFLPITLMADMLIAQLSFAELDAPAERPYGTDGLGSKYQGARSPVASRYGES